MWNDFARAKRDWDVEVDAEAARLIRIGYPPWDAVEQAVKNISKRRRECRGIGDYRLGTSD